MKLLATVAVLIVLAAAKTALAQRVQADEPEVSPGARIRVTVSSTVTVNDMIQLVDPALTRERVSSVLNGAAVTRDGQVLLVVPRPGARLQGAVVRNEPGAVALVPDNGTAVVTVPRAAIAQLQRSKGEGLGRLRHAGIGALIGMGVGAVFGLVVANGCTDCIGPSPEEAAARLGVIFGGLGAIIGSAVPAERWAPVANASAAHFPPRPQVVGFEREFRAVRVSFGTWSSSHATVTDRVPSPRFHLGFAAAIVFDVRNRKPPGR